VLGESRGDPPGHGVAGGGEQHTLRVGVPHPLDHPIPAAEADFFLFFPLSLASTTAKQAGRGAGQHAEFFRELDRTQMRRNE